MRDTLGLLTALLPAAASSLAAPPLDLTPMWLETPWGKPVTDRGPAGT